MIVDVVLGFNIDTSLWIKELKENQAENIVVVDYDYFGDLIVSEEVIYISAACAESYLKKYDSINFYKSLYVYPGMSGKMSEIYKKRM